MKKILLTIGVLLLYGLHQDLWNWRVVRPVVFGVLPVGLFYHVVYTLVVSGMMWLLVSLAWPKHLEADGDEADSGGERGGRR